MTTDTLPPAQASFHARTAAAQALFFTWLTRVFMAATLSGSAWIDDAPPLELAAWILTVLVGLGILTGLPHFLGLLPFSQRILKIGVAIIALLLLFMSFFTVTIFVGSVSSFVV